MDANIKKSNPNPKATANPVSCFFLWWMHSTFWKNFKGTFEDKNLYDVLEEDDSHMLGDQLERKWQEELLHAKKLKKSPSLFKVICKTFWKYYIFYLIILLLDGLILRILHPFCLGKLLEYFTHEDTIDKTDGYIYGCYLVAVIFLRLFARHHYNLGSFCIGMRIRVACCSLVYRKVLRLNKFSMEQTTKGKIVNLMSNDVGRFDQATVYLSWLWVSFIQVVLITYILWNIVNTAAFIGCFFIFMSTIPLQGFLGRMVSKFRKKIAVCTDARMKLMSEILSGIQVIKMYAWEKPFAKLVSLARKNEINVITKASYIRAYYNSTCVFTERASLFVTLLAYWLFGNPVYPDKVFALAQYFNVLNLTMAFCYPMAIMNFAEGRVSIQRLQEFLMHDDNTSEKLCNSVNENIGQVTLSGVHAQWNADHETVKDINLVVEKGELCAVTGPVACGKSTLLHMILGELPLSSGVLRVGGRVVFASQEPWIFVGSVRQNIIFGQCYNVEKYQQVIRACALMKDLDLLPNGDQTLVGERGITLSGGQKARLNLARAMYQDADIYLLDDPLSAVDAHVGKHLLEECINGYLKHKTRILVTHQLQHIKTADIILGLNNGKIERIGSYTDLFNSDENFKKLMLNSEEHEEDESFTKHSFEEHSKIVDDSGVICPPCGLDNMENIHIPSRFWKYFQSAQSPFMLISTAITLLLAQVLYSVADYWTSFWSDAELRKTEGLEPILNMDLIVQVYGALIIACIIMTIFRSLLFHKLCMRISQKLHDTMFSRILRTTMHFFDTNPTGSILNRFSKDIGIVDELLPNSIIMPVQIALLSSGILVLILMVNFYFFIPVVAVGALLIGIIVFTLPTPRNLKMIEGRFRSPLFSHLSDSLSGLTTIRAANAVDIVIKDFDNYQNQHTSAWFLFLTSCTSVGFWIDFIISVLVTFIIFMFLLIPHESISSSQIGLAISQSLILTGMIQQGVIYMTDAMSHMTSAERVIEYTSIEQESALESGLEKEPAPSWPSKGVIEFQHVTLTYSSDSPPVLKDLHFIIGSKSKVGVVGRTGAGKSSLVSALFRLAPVEGTVLIDCLDISSIGLNDLRRCISIIPQDPLLFSATLRYNLDPFQQFQDDELWAVLQEVELKLDTLEFQLSEGGSNLSVGQRQLVCLARAMLRNNRILVLDEATANVDSETDMLIQKTIRTKFKNCTVLTIAHRLNTIMDSDMVMVMEAGTIVEYDEPYILLQDHDSYFYTLVQQMGKTMAENLYCLAKEAYFNENRNSSIDCTKL